MHFLGTIRNKFCALLDTVQRSKCLVCRRLHIFVLELENLLIIAIIDLCDVVPKGQRLHGSGHEFPFWILQGEHSVDFPKISANAVVAPDGLVLHIQHEVPPADSQC